MIAHTNIVTLLLVAVAVSYWSPAQSAQDIGACGSLGELKHYILDREGHEVVAYFERRGNTEDRDVVVDTLITATPSGDAWYYFEGRRSGASTLADSRFCVADRGGRIELLDRASYRANYRNEVNLAIDGQQKVIRQGKLHWRTRALQRDSWASLERAGRTPPGDNPNLLEVMGYQFDFRDERPACQEALRRWGGGSCSTYERVRASGEAAGHFLVLEAVADPRDGEEGHILSLTLNTDEDLVTVYATSLEGASVRRYAGKKYSDHGWAFIPGAVAPGASVQNGELWPGIRHGITLAEVREAYPNAQRPEEPTTLLRGEKGLLVIPDLELAELSGEGTVFFHDERVVSFWIDWAAPEGEAASISAQLERSAIKRYGPPALWERDDLGHELEWRPADLRISLLPPGLFDRVRLVVTPQAEFKRVPADLEELMSSPESEATVEQFFASDAEGMKGIFIAITQSIFDYYGGADGNQEAIACMNRLSNEPDEQFGNRLAGLFMEALRGSREELLLKQPVRNAWYAKVKSTCAPEEWERKSDRTKKVLEAMREEYARKAQQAKARLDELERNAWELPDGTKVFRDDQNGRERWVYRDGTPVPPGLARQVRPPRKNRTAHLETPEAVSIAGRYRVSGVNPNGSRYSGSVVVSRVDGDVYRFHWTIGRQSYVGAGRLENGRISVDYGDQYPAIYSLEQDKSLSGTWSNGRGREMLSPVP